MCSTSWRGGEREGEGMKGRRKGRKEGGRACDDRLGNGETPDSFPSYLRCIVKKRVVGLVEPGKVRLDVGR
jgi:hypothetical protein